MADARLCAVTITAPEESWLADFVRSLVADRLCAGAHNTSPIRSIYRWQGEIYDRPEAHVTLHTRAEHVASIVARANDQHPYEVPCKDPRARRGGAPSSARPASMSAPPATAPTARRVLGEKRGGHRG